MGEVADVNQELEQMILHPRIPEANSFFTKGEVPVSLQYRDVEDPVHTTFTIVKGYDREKTAKDPRTVNFVTLFAPSEKVGTWLKIVHPDAVVVPEKYAELHDRLLTSVDMGKAAFRLVGLPELAGQTKICETTILGKKVLGFTAPHVGPSVGHLLERFTGSQRPSKLPADLIPFFKDVYIDALNQAVDLFLKHGYYMQDPNPGNILFHQRSDGGVQVVLIDFANTHQLMKPVYSPPIPEGKFSHEETMRKQYKSASNYLLRQADILRPGFADMAERLGFSLPLDQMWENIRQQGLQVAIDHSNPFVQLNVSHAPSSNDARPRKV
jgi:hypothetical protein